MNNNKPSYAPDCWGTGKCVGERDKATCGWIGTCFEATITALKTENINLKREVAKLKKKVCRHHPMELRSSDEVRAEMKRQDDKVKEEGHWQG
jgi:putative component of membrane protein insertase Oxa1/YidC/SpoIIIJ protein YidD